MTSAELEKRKQECLSWFEHPDARFFHRVYLVSHIMPLISEVERLQQNQRDLAKKAEGLRLSKVDVRIAHANHHNALLDELIAGLTEGAE